MTLHAISAAGKPSPDDNNVATKPQTSMKNYLYEVPTTLLNYHARDLDVIPFPRVALLGTGFHWLEMDGAELGSPSLSLNLTDLGISGGGYLV